MQRAPLAVSENASFDLRTSCESYGAYLVVIKGVGVNRPAYHTRVCSVKGEINHAGGMGIYHSKYIIRRVDVTAVLIIAGNVELGRIGNRVQTARITGIGIIKVIHQVSNTWREV